MRLIQYSSRRVWTEQTAQLIAAAIDRTSAIKGNPVVIAAGGSTPANIYAALGKQPLDWSKVTILPSDERWVEGTSERSNFAMISAAFSDKPAAAAKLIRFYSAGLTAEEGAVKVQEQIQSILPADICLLGMGEDMHTASLFPNAPELEIALSASAPLATACVMPSTGEERVTLTAPALKSSRVVMLLISGMKKLTALKRAISINDPVKAPVAQFIENATVHFVE